MRGVIMAIHKLDKRANDNTYLHRDFHIAGDRGLQYLGEKYGDNGVKEYLRMAASSYYSLLIEEIKIRGFSAIVDHLKEIYKKEEASDALQTTINADSLDVHILYSPAINYMHSVDYTPSRWYIEQTRTCFETIADLVDMGFRMLSYNEQTGEAKYSFFRRKM